MTPKERAKELVDTYRRMFYKNDWCVDNGKGFIDEIATQEKAKQCALIAVDEILSLPHWSDCAVYNEPAMPKGKCDCGHDILQTYWQSVKNELNNI